MNREWNKGAGLTSNDHPENYTPAPFVLFSIHVIPNEGKASGWSEETYKIKEKMKIHKYYVYILTNKNDTVLYTGVTNNLVRRCMEHKQKKHRGFTRKYNLGKLVYFEMFDFIIEAIAREKQIKGYSRIKKIKLIESVNPEWDELYCDGKIKTPKIEKERGSSLEENDD